MMTNQQKRQYNYLLDFYSKAPLNVPFLPQAVVSNINNTTDPNVIKKLIFNINSGKLTFISKAYYCNVAKAWYFMHI